MAELVIVDGPALVRTGTGAVDALETLGYTEGGVEIIEHVFSAPVPGDQNGGPEGPPIDIQYFGEMHLVRLRLTKWDVAVAAKIEPRLKGGTTGTPGTPGTLWSADSKLYRLLISPTNRPRNYLGAIPRGVIERNKGTKFTTLIMEFECYSVGGTLWNTTTA